MALEDDINILSSVALFEAFTHDQLRLMAFGAERVQLGKDDELYAEGEAADCAYVVVTGRIGLLKDDDSGERRPVRAVRPGAILGELALITSSKRLTSAVAETDAEVLRIGHSLFRRVLEEYPDLAIALHRQIAARLSDLIRRIERLSRHFEG